MSDTNTTTHSEFPKGFDALPRPFVVVFGNQKYHSMVVRRFLIFFRRSDDSFFFFFFSASDDSTSFFWRATTQLHRDKPTPHFPIQVRTLIACQTEDTNLNSHDMCKINRHPIRSRFSRKNAAYLKNVRRKVDRKCSREFIPMVSSSLDGAGNGSPGYHVAS